MNLGGASADQAMAGDPLDDVELDRPERLLEVPPETVGYLCWPDRSPDGRHIACERLHYEGNVWTVDLR